MTQHVTLEIEIDEDAINEVIDIDWDGVDAGCVTGHAEIDIEDVMKRVVTGVGLVETNLPTEVAIAIKQSVGEPVWESNLEELVNDDAEFVEIEE